MSNSGQSPDEPTPKNTPEPGPSRVRGSMPVPKSKRGVKGFLNEVVREMKKVSWPTRPETNRLTTVVLAVCVLLVVFLSVIGYVFQFVIDMVTKGRV